MAKNGVILWTSAPKQIVLYKPPGPCLMRDKNGNRLIRPKYTPPVIDPRVSLEIEDRNESSKIKKRPTTIKNYIESNQTELIKDVPSAECSISELSLVSSDFPETLNSVSEDSMIYNQPQGFFINYGPQLVTNYTNDVTQVQLNEQNNRLMPFQSQATINIPSNLSEIIPETQPGNSIDALNNLHSHQSNISTPFTVYQPLIQNFPESYVQPYPSAVYVHDPSVAKVPTYEIYSGSTSVEKDQAVVQHSNLPVDEMFLQPIQGQLLTNAEETQSSDKNESLIYPEITNQNSREINFNEENTNCKSSSFEMTRAQEPILDYNTCTLYQPTSSIYTQTLNDESASDDEKTITMITVSTQTEDSDFSTCDDSIPLLLSPSQESKKIETDSNLHELHNIEIQNDLYSSEKKTCFNTPSKIVSLNMSIENKQEIPENDSLQINIDSCIRSNETTPKYIPETNFEKINETEYNFDLAQEDDKKAPFVKNISTDLNSFYFEKKNSAAYSNLETKDDSLKTVFKMDPKTENCETNTFLNCDVYFKNEACSIDLTHTLDEKKSSTDLTSKLESSYPCKYQSEKPLSPTKSSVSKNSVELDDAKYSVISPKIAGSSKNSPLDVMIHPLVKNPDVTNSDEVINSKKHLFKRLYRKNQLKRVGRMLIPPLKCKKGRPKKEIKIQMTQETLDKTTSSESVLILKSNSSPHKSSETLNVNLEKSQNGNSLNKRRGRPRKHDKKNNSPSSISSTNCLKKYSSHDEFISNSPIKSTDENNSKSNSLSLHTHNSHTRKTRQSCSEVTYLGCTKMYKRNKKGNNNNSKHRYPEFKSDEKNHNIKSPIENCSSSTFHEENKSCLNIEKNLKHEKNEHLKSLPFSDKKEAYNIDGSSNSKQDLSHDCITGQNKFDKLKSWKGRFIKISKNKASSISICSELSSQKNSYELSFLKESSLFPAAEKESAKSVVPDKCELARKNVIDSNNSVHSISNISVDSTPKLKNISVKPSENIKSKPVSSSHHPESNCKDPELYEKTLVEQSSSSTSPPKLRLLASKIVSGNDEFDLQSNLISSVSHKKRVVSENKLSGSSEILSQCDEKQANLDTEIQSSSTKQRRGRPRKNIQEVKSSSFLCLNSSNLKSINIKSSENSKSDSVSLINHPKPSSISASPPKLRILADKTLSGGYKVESQPDHNLSVSLQRIASKNESDGLSEITLVNDLKQTNLNSKMQSNSIKRKRGRPCKNIEINSTPLIQLNSLMTETNINPGENLQSESVSLINLPKHDCKKHEIDNVSLIKQSSLPTSPAKLRVLVKNILSGHEINESKSDLNFSAVCQKKVISEKECASTSENVLQCDEKQVNMSCEVQSKTTLQKREKPSESCEKVNSSLLNHLKSKRGRPRKNIEKQVASILHEANALELDSDRNHKLETDHIHKENDLSLTSTINGIKSCELALESSFNNKTSKTKQKRGRPRKKMEKQVASILHQANALKLDCDSNHKLETDHIHLTENDLSLTPTIDGIKSCKPLESPFNNINKKPRFKINFEEGVSSLPQSIALELDCDKLQKLDTDSHRENLSASMIDEIKSCVQMTVISKNESLNLEKNSDRRVNQSALCEKRVISENEFSDPGENLLLCDENPVDISCEVQCKSTLQKRRKPSKSCEKVNSSLLINLNSVKQKRGRPRKKIEKQVASILPQANALKLDCDSNHKLETDHIHHKDNDLSLTLTIDEVKSCKPALESSLNNISKKPRHEINFEKGVSSLPQSIALELDCDNIQNLDTNAHGEKLSSASMIDEIKSCEPMSVISKNESLNLEKNSEKSVNKSGLCEKRIISEKEFSDLGENLLQCDENLVDISCEVQSKSTLQKKGKPSESYEKVNYSLLINLNSVKQKRGRPRKKIEKQVASILPQANALKLDGDNKHKLDTNPHKENLSSAPTTDEIKSIAQMSVMNNDESLNLEKRVNHSDLCEKRVISENELADLSENLLQCDEKPVDMSCEVQSKSTLQKKGKSSESCEKVNSSFVIQLNSVKQKRRRLKKVTERLVKSCSLQTNALKLDSDSIHNLNTDRIHHIQNDSSSTSTTNGIKSCKPALESSFISKSKKPRLEINSEKQVSSLPQAITLELDCDNIHKLDTDSHKENLSSAFMIDEIKSCVQISVNSVNIHGVENSHSPSPISNSDGIISCVQAATSSDVDDERPKLRKKFVKPVDSSLPEVIDLKPHSDNVYKLDTENIHHIESSSSTSVVNEVKSCVLTAKSSTNKRKRRKRKRNSENQVKSSLSQIISLEVHNEKVHPVSNSSSPLLTNNNILSSSYNISEQHLINGTDADSKSNQVLAGTKSCPSFFSNLIAKTSMCSKEKTKDSISLRRRKSQNLLSTKIDAQAIQNPPSSCKKLLMNRKPTSKSRPRKQSQILFSNWRREEVRRLNNPRQIDVYYYPPCGSPKLRSLVQVKKYCKRKNMIFNPKLFGAKSIKEVAKQSKISSSRFKKESSKDVSSVTSGFKNKIESKEVDFSLIKRLSNCQKISLQDVVTVKNSILIKDFMSLTSEIKQKYEPFVVLTRVNLNKDEYNNIQSKEISSYSIDVNSDYSGIVKQDINTLGNCIPIKDFTSLHDKIKHKFEPRVVVTPISFTEEQ